MEQLTTGEFKVENQPEMELSAEQLKQFQELMGQPWSMHIRFDPETRQYMSEISELGISAFAETRLEACTGAEDVLHLFLLDQVINGQADQLPLPLISSEPA